MNKTAVVWHQARVWLLLAMLVLPGTTTCQQSPKPPEIRIGLIVSLSGNLGNIGDSAVAAAELAVADINDAGGIDIAGQKHRLVLLIEDDHDVPDLAVAAARKLIFQENVVGLIGPQLSRNAIPVARVAEEARVPMISPSSTNPATTDGRQFVFRVAFLDSFQGEVMAQFARQELGAQQAAVLFDVASAYNRDIAAIFRQVFENSGGEITAFESYTTGELDFSRQLEQIRRSAPDVLFLPNYASELPVQAEQARAAGIDSIIIGSDSWQKELLAEEPALEGAFFSAHYSPDQTGEPGRAFVTAYQEQYGEMPDEGAALTYDAFGLLFQAMQNGENGTPEAIRVGLDAITRFEGVTGTMTFQDTGDPLRSAVIWRLTEGEAILYDQIDP